MKPKILIYQPENDSAMLVKHLTLNNFSIDLATDNNIFSKLRKGDFDLCVLCHSEIKSESGPLCLLDFLRQIDTRVPVIFLSDLSNYSDIVKAFKAGVDDYVVKPYNLEEFICRLQALLKRGGVKTRSIANSYNIGSFTFKVKEKILNYKESQIKITTRESDILALLCAYEDEVVPKKILLQTIWNEDNYFVRRSLDVYICTLRNHFKADNSIKIDTIRGVGYRLRIEKDDAI